MDGSFLGPLSGLYAILHIVCDLITCLFHAELPMQERELYVVKPHSIYCSNLFSAVWQAATEEANAQQAGHALVANELLSSALCCVRAILQQLAVTYCQPFTFHVTSRSRLPIARPLPPLLLSTVTLPRKAGSQCLIHIRPHNSAHRKPTDAYRLLFCRQQTSRNIGDIPLSVAAFVLATTF